MTYWPRDTDSETIAALGEEVQAIARSISVLREQERRLEILIDEARLAQKPDFPTDRQRELLVMAARNIHDRVKSRSHLGDAALDGDYTVKVDGERGWISVQDLAPYAARSGQRLWSFTDEDVEAFREILRGEGLEPLDSWLHQDGVSIVSRVAP